MKKTYRCFYNNKTRLEVAEVVGGNFKFQIKNDYAVVPKLGAIELAGAILNSCNEPLVNLDEKKEGLKVSEVFALIEQGKAKLSDFKDKDGDPLSFGYKAGAMLGYGPFTRDVPKPKEEKLSVADQYFNASKALIDDADSVVTARAVDGKTYSFISQASFSEFVVTVGIKFFESFEIIKDKI